MNVTMWVQNILEIYSDNSSIVFVENNKKLKTNVQKMKKFCHNSP